jgi:peptidyl-dipeptidase Dcp
MEKSGQVLDRATNVFFNLIGTDKNDAREKLESDYAPKFSAHRDAIALDPKLFARIKTLYDARATLGLDAIDLRLLEKRYTDFVRSRRQRWTTRRRRASARSTPTCPSWSTQFNQNVLAEVNDSAIVVDSRDELKGMGEEQIAAAAEAAKARGLEGKYVIALLNTTGQPAEAQLENRALRERLHKASVARGSRGNQWDNTGIVSQVLKLRAERATLLGYDTYANYVLADETAANQDNVESPAAPSWRRPR